LKKKQLISLSSMIKINLRLKSVTDGPRASNPFRRG